MKIIREKVLLRESADLIVVVGDVNSTIACALVASKLGIPVAHVEAGLRSYDLRMPEEYNRRLVDHLADLLFAPTTLNQKILKGEKVLGKIFVTGNTVIDSCLLFMPIAKKRSKIMKNLDLVPESYALATIHRAENVDLKATFEAFIDIFSNCPLPVILPLHPRTVKLAGKFGLKDRLLNDPNINIIDPIGYFDFLVLMKNSKFIITDSGGIQEEATSSNINRKVFVLRNSTERPEAVDAGYCEVVGTNKKNALKAINEHLEIKEELNKPSPYGKGNSAKIIIDVIKKHHK